MSEQAVISEVPGVFYRKPSPDEPVYVEEGQEVKAGETIGLIEVMKNFYEVTAPADGTVKAFKAEEGDVIDAGQEIAVIE
ncbi:acetyl-CoA carboxylase [Fictibacillus enclensis]|uniref:acetyl-CoA carboxylase n=1 Tax=Fictibacillus enclensis TaxID=1017270 RepID=UPI0025A17C0C|nr:acetyl-CoA carboxylase [Fictibacillus enclensis]MDM5201204.1 acetyl-CoA carboxylase [Fictibacillus enclensis]MDM5340611.1 acetyl-CoA carboxylase [Fictibacillus enclensis]